MTQTWLYSPARLADARRLMAETTAWIRQLDDQRAGNYARAAEVTQYRLADTTDQLAGKLGGIERQLAGLLQRPDNKLPEAVAERARACLDALDKQAQPNQMAAVYALRGDQFERANERQQAAYDGLAAAEKAFDQMMRLAVSEMDKLPVQDPIAQLLEDPTLDDLLADLERELPLRELLGIGNRPTNLQILGDWLRPGMMGGGAGAMFGNQMRQQDRQARNRLNRAYQDAIRRARKGIRRAADDRAAPADDYCELEPPRFAARRRPGAGSRQGPARAISPGNRAVFQ